VHGVVSFYHDYRSHPAGRHVLKLCQAEACQSMGSDAIAAQVIPGGHGGLAGEAPAIIELGLTIEQANTIVQHVTAALPLLVSAAGVG